MKRPEFLLPALLKDFPVERFLDEYYLKQPYAQVGGCDQIIPRFGRGDLLQMMSHPEADFLAGQGGTQWPGAVPTTLDGLEELLAKGFTVGLRHAHRHHPDLDAIARCFRRELAGRVDIHVYCTPRAAPGFGWHYDAEEVFIFQTQGEKDWYLRKNTVNPWPLIETIPVNQRYEREVMPVLHCQLHAGDWLYIPAGYWHRTVANNESTSLSIGIEASTAIDIFDLLRPQLLQSLLWRQRLPCAGAIANKSQSELLAGYTAILTTLADDLATHLKTGTLAQDFVNTIINRID